MRIPPFIPVLALVFIVMAVPGSGAGAGAGDLPQILEKGVIRHLGVPYANFVTGSGDGLDVEVVKRFASKLGVRYLFVRSSWPDVIGDLTGTKVRSEGDEIRTLGRVPVKGDMIASGFTILEWRKKAVAYSIPVFPTQVWVVAGAGAGIHPISPGRDAASDIRAVKSRLSGMRVLGKADTCIDPDLYDIRAHGARVILFDHGLNDLVPAVISGDADATLLDLPDSLIALEKWPGRIKVIGPVSHEQQMGMAFPKSSVKLREAFNRFMARLMASGQYRELVERYYPAVFSYYPGFFEPGQGPALE